MIEKPFGPDLESALQLNDIVESVVPPDAVFRVDHYLGKETVQNIVLRGYGELAKESESLVTAIEVEGASDSPSTILLAAWLHQALDAPVTIVADAACLPPS